MLKNYIKIAWRNLTRQTLYSLINISGLAVGLAVCMMIMLYVTHEMSYDNFHKNADRIFLPRAQMVIGGSTMNMEHLSYASGSMIKQGQPTVEGYMRTLKYFEPIVVSNTASPEHKFSDENLLFADAGFFNFFSFKLKSGQAASVLSKPFSVVISEATAKKYFGTTDAVGKTLNIKTDSSYTYQVTGVAENNPSNSSINYNFVVSTSSLFAMKNGQQYIGEPRIAGGAFNTYLLLKHAADTAALKRGLQLTVKKNKDFHDEQYLLSAFTDIHLKFNSGDSSGVKYLKIFPLVALLILLLALVNYMSLSTARATLRAKEIGVRKVSGASRKAIAIQFYVESILFATISFILGYLLCYAAKPWFLNILQLKIDNSFLYSPLVLLLLAVLLLITIIIAGSYPSLVLSAFKPVVTLKGKMSKQAGGVLVRKVFTTLQFTISVGLIICGIIIDRQLFYFRHADTGINRDNVLVVPVNNTVGQSYPAFKKEVQSLSGVQDAATSHYAMFKGYDVFFIQTKAKGDGFPLASLAVDDHFVSTLGLQWKIKPIQHPSTANNIIINEAAIGKLKLPANPIGSFIDAGAGKYEVIGVLKNFNFTSMEYAVEPLGLFVGRDTEPSWGTVGCNLFARVNPHTNLPTLINNIKAIYKNYDKDTPFSYSFMDEAFNEQYKAEDRLASIFGIFTVITIVLATLGLFGLAAFTIEQRTKEIGIRKVLGASLTSITTLLSKDFLKLVLLSIVLASPIAWWAMHKWLQNFAFRISIPWWIFVMAGLIAILSAILTVSYHAIKSALTAPVKSLRSE